MARKPTKAADPANDKRSDPAKAIVGTTDPITTDVVEDTMQDPDKARQDDGTVAVKGLAPANPFKEPLADEYPEGKLAEVTQGSTKPVETIVEHPLSPTDSNPNPHGNRDEAVVSVPVKDEDGKVKVERPEQGTIEVEGTEDNPVHLGDGRVLGKGQRTKVTAELLKDENLKGKVKRV